MIAYALLAWVLVSLLLAWAWSRLPRQEQS
jgi:hypothetical protein